MTKAQTFKVMDDPERPRRGHNTMETFSVQWTRNGRKCGSSAYMTEAAAQKVAKGLDKTGAGDIRIVRAFFGGFV